MAYKTPLPPGYDPTYELSSIVATVDATTPMDELIRPGTTNWLVDALDQRFLDLLQSLTSWTPVVWRGGKITTFCYTHYGVQNMWLILLAYNGLSSPMQLRPGMFLRLPQKTAIDAYLKTLVPPAGVQIGTVITI